MINRWNKILLFFLIVLSISCKSKSTIPTIYITSEKELNFDSKEASGVYYKFKNQTFSTTSKVKYRGGFSRQFEKHSFTVDLDSSYSIAGLPLATDWILNASYIDKTFLRHKLSFDLFREMNSKNVAPQCAYINVEYNEIPQGLYVVMQQINKSSLNLAREGGMLFKEPPVFYQERFDSIQPINNYYDQKYPAISKQDYSNTLESFKQFLFMSDEKSFADSIKIWVDIENIIDWHLMLLLTNNGDGIMKNFYLYKLNSETAFRIALWDFDHTFCRDGDNEYNDLSSELNWRKNVLLKRLTDGNVNGYTNQLKARWLELRSSGLFTVRNLSEQMKNNRFTFEGELENNAKIWPYSSNWYFDDNTFEQEYDLMLDCIKKRLPQIDEYIGTL